MSERVQIVMPTPRSRKPRDELPVVCPVCGAMVEARRINGRAGWTCLIGGYAHYFQARYGYLERWFTSGEGNLREPLIGAMNCAA